MKIQVDQSGKVERLNTATVVGGSNGEKHAIVVTAGRKQRLIPLLRKTLIPVHDLYFVFFAVLVFLLLREFKENVTRVEIDEEYSGKEGVIEEALVKLLERAKMRPPAIHFTRIGKRSAAHHVAIETHRSKTFLSARRITEEQILSLWKQKSRS